MRKILFIPVLVLALVVGVFAQQGKGNGCTPVGVWYGGSVVAYTLTITQTGPAGHFITYGEGVYKTSIVGTGYQATLEKHGNRYEGAGMALETSDPEYLNPPPFEKMPDLVAAWFSMEMIDCNTIRNVIPFFGTYFGAGFWQPGSPWTGMGWISGGKMPFVDPPDLDMIPILTGNTKPIVETYHRISRTVNPNLLHYN
jgi:hypothetical protein